MGPSTISGVLLLLASSCCCAHAANTTAIFNARTWQGSGMDYLWPEEGCSELEGRADVALAFSGGGSRAFACAVGQARALEALGLMAKARLLSSVSGGSWFATMYYYYQNLGGSAEPDDATFLCPYTAPEDEALAQLGVLPAGCALNAPTKSFYAAVAEGLAKSLVDPLYDMDQVWADAVAAVFFEPWGIKAGDSYFSWNASTVEGILARNPATLGAAKGPWVKPFLLPRSETRPFPIFVGTVDGPRSVGGDGSWLGGLAPCNRSFTQLHQTPLYVGQPVVAAITYVQGCAKGRGEDDHPECQGKEATVSTGGFVEPFAFGSQFVDASTLLPFGTKASGVARVSAPPSVFGITDAAAVSSMGPSAVFEEPSCPDPLRPYWPHLKEIEISKAVWPTSEPAAFAAFASSGAPRLPSAAAGGGDVSDDDGAAALVGSVDMVLGDGGNLDNVGLFGLLQRRAGAIVLFCNTEAQLDPAWDMAAALEAGTWPNPAEGDVKVDNFLAAAFGFQQRGCDAGDFSNSLQFTARNQVFASSAFGGLVAALQGAIAAGAGAVATVSLETVGNAWLGVPGGQAVNLTVVYNDVPAQWLAALSPEVAAEVAQGKAGAFPNFPFYSTLGQIRLSAAEGALLADMQTWIVQKNFAPGSPHSAAFDAPAYTPRR